MRKWIVLAGAVLLQSVLGSVYAWSTFVPALRARHGLATSETQLVFAVAIAVFTVAMLAAGRLIDRVGPRLLAMAGAALYGGGYLLAGLGDGAAWQLVLCIGVLSGVGIALGYVCPLSTCALWFPRRRGLVTGVAVAGFGGGAIAVNLIGESLLAGGWGVLQIFQAIGIAGGIVALLGASVLARPARHAASHETADRAKAVLPAGWRRETLLLSSVMAIGTFAGLLVVGNLKAIGLAAGLETTLASVAVSVFAVGNAGGRVLWGWLSDRLEGRSLPVSLLILAAAVGVLVMGRQTAAGFLVASVLVGAGFGACFVVFAGQVTRRFGPEALGRVYPWVFLGYGLSGLIAPTCGGWLYDYTDSYLPSLALSIGLLLVGTLLVRSLRESEQAEEVAEDEEDEGRARQIA